MWLRFWGARMLSLTCVKRKPLRGADGKPIQIWSVRARYTVEGIPAECESSADSPAAALAMCLLSLLDAYGVKVDTSIAEPLDVYELAVRHIARLDRASLAGTHVSRAYWCAS